MHRQLSQDHASNVHVVSSGAADSCSFVQLSKLKVPLPVIVLVDSVPLPLPLPSTDNRSADGHAMRSFLSTQCEAVILAEAPNVPQCPETNAIKDW